ncbi:MAG: 3-dehydroquinate synthase, partial [Evtepia sp.]
VIKYGMIGDPGLLDLMETTELKKDPEEIVARCVARKRDLVEQDEFDTGARQLLNLGHTIGHGIEACSGYQLSHGKAVAIGMTLITRAAVSFGLCPAEALPRLQSLLKKYCLPDATEYGAQALYEKTLSDKKRTGSTIRLVVPTAWGKSQLHQVAVPDLLQWIEKGLSL